MIEIFRVTDLYFRAIPYVSALGIVLEIVSQHGPKLQELMSKLLQPSQSAPCTLDYSPARLLVDKIKLARLFTCNHAEYEPIPTRASHPQCPRPLHL